MVRMMDDAERQLRAKLRTIPDGEWLGPSALDGRERVYALAADTEGETTALYLAPILKKAGVKVSRLALGLPAGGGLEYADSVTLGYALSGRRGDALQTLDRLLALSKRTQVSKYPIAAVYAALGDKGQAFAYLNRAYDEHSFMLGFLRVDPALDPLRSDPRFNALLARLGLGN